MRQTTRTARPGFSIIELLTVIAVIAILAALIFPVFGRVREQSRQGGCMTQLHEISVAMKLYFQDNNQYPPALLGFVTNTDGELFTGGNGSPAALVSTACLPLSAGQKYLKDKETFACPNNTVNNPAVITPAVYSNTSPLSGQPVLYTPELAKHIKLNKNVPVGQPVYFYPYDSYDIGPQIDVNGRPVRDNNGNTVYELHYALDWTGQTGPGDASNQLKYSNAPEDSTVVTWCTHHAAVGGSDKVLVLMLNGKAKAVPVSRFMQRGPLQLGN